VDRGSGVPYAGRVSQKRHRLSLIVLCALGPAAVLAAPASAAPPDCTNQAVAVPAGATTLAAITLTCAGTVTTFAQQAPPPQNGTVTFDDVAVPPTATYTPTTTPIVDDAFTYVASNAGEDDPTPATVTLDVAPACPNQPDVETDVDTPIDVPLTCTGPANAYTIVADPTNGTLDETQLGAGAVTYTPAPGFTGTDSFTFEATNGVATSTPATVVTIEVRPVCEDADKTTGYLLPVTINLVCTGTGGVIEIVAQPLKGTLIGDPTTGSVEYRNDIGVAGTDTFTFKATNGGAESALATVTINVSAPSGGGGGGGGGGGFDSGGLTGGGLAPDPDESAPGDRLPSIPFLPSLFGGGGNDNIRTTFARDAAVRISRGSARVSPTGRVRLRIANANPFQVDGRLTVEGVFKRTKKGRRVARLRMGAPQVSVRAGKSVTVELRLSRAEQRLLRRLGKATVRVAFQVRDIEGHARTIRTTFTLRAPR
jgi:hypothetical protein